MKFLKLVLILFISSCNSTWKKTQERLIYTNETIQIIGKDLGLPENIRTVKLNIENLISFEREFFRPFDLKLRYYIEFYGLKIHNHNDEETNFATIDVKISSLMKNENIEITNFNLLYNLEIFYSLQDSSGNFIQSNKAIREYILVFDTNRYNDEKVLNYLADLSARHLVEKVKLGWQQDYSKTDRKIFVLGGKPIETTNSTNRGK